MNSRNKLAEMPIRPLLYTMAVPLMLSLLVQSLYNIVDSIFVARLSETALTAASLVYSIQFLMIAVGVGTVIFWCFPGQLLQLFSASSEMLLLGIPALRIISISFVMSAITILCGYFSSGLGNGIINMVGAAIRQLILLVPCLWIFIKISGISHGWYAFWIAEIIACISIHFFMSFLLLPVLIFHQFKRMKVYCTFSLKSEE